MSEKLPKHEEIFGSINYTPPPKDWMDAKINFEAT